MAEPFIGQILQVGFNYAPRGWAMCNGQLQSIAQNNAMFALLGTTFGGDGVNTFALPNLQGRTMVGVGTLAGGSTYVLGEAAGNESTTLLQNNMPAHTHAITATMQASTGQGTNAGAAAGSFLSRVTDTAPNNPGKPAIYSPAPATNPVNLGGLNVAAAPTGGNAPLSILSPYLAITTIIALEGIFPARN